MKKWIKILIIVLVILCVLGFILKKLVRLDYKKSENGNNKSIQEIEQYILNIESYKANLYITVTSNKNVNFYDITQEVKLPDMAKQVATSPEDLAGVEMIYKDGNLEIKNSKHNLTKIYNNYPYISNNGLFLTSFIEGYKSSEEKEIIEKEEQIEMKYKSGQNKYNSIQTLYINKSNLKPVSMQILDMNKDCKVNIEYKEIEFNI